MHLIRREEHIEDEQVLALRTLLYDFIYFLLRQFELRFQELAQHNQTFFRIFYFTTLQVFFLEDLVIGMVDYHSYDASSVFEVMGTVKFRIRNAQFTM